VIHKEQNSEVALDIFHLRTLLALYERINPAKYMIGWFTTGADVSINDAIINNYWLQEHHTHLHLTLDTGFSTEGNGVIRTYITRPVFLGGKNLATAFMEIPNEVKLHGINPIDSRIDMSFYTPSISDHLDGSKKALHHLHYLLNKVEHYCNDICVGKQKSDYVVGWTMANVLHCILNPLSKCSISPMTLQKVLYHAWLDSLLVKYVSRVVMLLVNITDFLARITCSIRHLE
jgi:hypothetical protein